MRYAVRICGDQGDCPHDPAFEHRFYFGCVPKTFSDRTGRAKGHSQTPHMVDMPKRGDTKVILLVMGDTPAPAADGNRLQRWFWDGGCDAALLAKAGV